MTPHKHAEVIKAWADGAEIQWKSPGDLWVSLPENSSPAWSTNFEYRVKPQPKKCIPYKRYLIESFGNIIVCYMDKNNIWRPEHGLNFLKWIDTEWQEHEYDA